MPRRQLLRTIGAALAVGALEALRPRTASAAVSAQDCGGGCTPRIACCVRIKMGYHHGGCYTPPAEECCVGPNGETGKAANLMSWTCKTGKCGQWGQCIPDCAADRERCGNQCCPVGWGCGSPRLGRCCQPGYAKCFDSTGQGRCCPPGQPCIDGKCCEKCPGGVCCDRAVEFCCGDPENPKAAGFCCKNTDSCCALGPPGAEQRACCPAPNKCARQLTRAIGGLTGNSPNVCCPPARQVWNPGDRDPMACCDPSQFALPPGKMIIDAASRGIQGMCCDTICGTGANLTCCPTGKSCIGGRCVVSD